MTTASVDVPCHHGNHPVQINKHPGTKVHKLEQMFVQWSLLCSLKSYIISQTRHNLGKHYGTMLEVLTLRAGIKVTVDVIYLFHDSGE